MMMGRHSAGQDKLFYSFNLEDHVPADHLLRAIDRCLDLGKLRTHLASYYSHTGRPSVDPELMIRMLLVGYCYGIRSERRLCEEVHLNLAYRWFCRLGLEDALPDHSTFSKNRHGRFRSSGAFRFVFDAVVRTCMRAGLIKAEGFAVDASVVSADARGQRSVPGQTVVDWTDPQLASRAVQEYLQALQMQALGQSEPAKVSLTDPQASWTAAPGGPAFFAYSTNYLVDTAHGVIVDVDATRANKSAELEATKAMIDRVKAQFALNPGRLIGDTAYGSAAMLAWLVNDRAIEPHIPVWGKSERTDGTFSTSAFEWDEKANEYRCPAGKRLRPRWRNFTTARSGITKANTIIYRASERDCGACPLKAQCCPNTQKRKIVRSVHEQAREVARRLSTTAQYRQSRRERKKVEMLFAHLKRILKLDRLRLRGLSGARDEFVLAATAQNLRRLAKLFPRSPPVNGIGAPA
jgi:transposase